MERAYLGQAGTCQATLCLYASHLYASHLSLIISPLIHFLRESTIIHSNQTMVKDKQTTSWDRNDEAILVHTLKQHKVLGHFADGNPKKIVWTACEEVLSGSEKKSGGVPKTAVAIKNCWQRVHRFSS